MIEITANPGETFLDRMIGLVESASRRKTPKQIALNILLAALTIIFMIAVVTLEDRLKAICGTAGVCFPTSRFASGVPRNSQYFAYTEF